MKSDVSVVIPLYNKEREILGTLSSVLAQRTLPLEVIVVDDGSTDRSADLVEALSSPLVRLIRQPNRGVSAARNRAVAEARGRWIALLDGDDRWESDYLSEQLRMAAAWPGCGAYATSFLIDDGKRLTPADTPRSEGIVDFFAEALQRYVLVPSAAMIDRALYIELGGFPEGMRLGEDQWFWTRLARRASVCCSTARLAIYARNASNRSASIWRPECTPYTFEELYDEQQSTPSNEYVARAALGKFLVVSAKGGTDEARRAARFFAYTRRNRFALLKLRLLNALPVRWRAPLLGLYNRAAWLLVRRGL